MPHLRAHSSRGADRRIWLKNLPLDAISGVANSSFIVGPVLLYRRHTKKEAVLTHRPKFQGRTS